MTAPASWTGQMRRHIARLARWSSAHVAIRIEEYAFDYLLYPFMLYRGGDLLLSTLLAPFNPRPEALSAAGYWAGFAVLIAASIAINVAYVRAYDRLKTDWFGFEALKDAVERLPSGLRQQPWREATRFAAFAYLSIWHNPLFATLFMRREPSAYAMTPADWRTFWMAIVIANIGWAGLVSGAVELGKWLLELLA